MRVSREAEVIGGPSARQAPGPGPSCGASSSSPGSAQARWGLKPLGVGNMVPEHTVWGIPV